jgi:hypothetical protein
MSYFPSGKKILLPRTRAVLPAVLVAALVCVPATYAQQPLWAPKPTGKVVSKPIDEMSGLARSPGRSNTFWVHNDSGDSARIFAITEDGKSILPTYSKFTSYGDEPEKGKEQWQGFEVLNAKNIDWEDIAADENYLYIADTGNNFNKRRDLGIYLISKIDPTASTRSAVIEHLPVAYPEQSGSSAREKHFDAESLFVDHGTIYLITKHRSGLLGLDYERGANLYRLDTRFTDKPNMLHQIDSNAAIFAATGADLSPDGKTLAVISLEALWLFARPSSGDQWLSAPAKRYPFDRKVLKVVEAITWIDNDTLLLGNEQRDLFKVALKDLPAPTPP